MQWGQWGIDLGAPGFGFTSQFHQRDIKKVSNRRIFPIGPRLVAQAARQAERSSFRREPVARKLSKLLLFHSGRQIEVPLQFWQN
jgi:hypothetical protein